MNLPSYTHLLCTKLVAVIEVIIAKTMVRKMKIGFGGDKQGWASLEIRVFHDLVI